MNKQNLFNKLKDILTRKKTVSILLICVFMAAALSSMFISPRLYQWSIHEGDIALKDIYAPYDFVYQWEVYEEGTERARNAAAEAVPYLFSRDLESENNVRSTVEVFFSMLEEQKKLDIPVEGKVASIEEMKTAKLSARDIKVMLEHTNPAILKSGTIDVLNRVFTSGIAGKEDLVRLNKENAGEIIIVGEKTSGEIRKEVSDLLSERGIQNVIRDFADEQFNENKKVSTAVAALLSAHITPNLRLDKERTKAKKEEIASKVPDVYRNWTIKKNELMIEKGKRVNARHIAQIEQLRVFFQHGKSPKFFLGALLLFLLLGLVASIHIIFTQKKKFIENTKKMALVLLSMFLTILISDLIMRSPQPSHFIPMAAMGMILTLLIGFNIAFLSVIIVSILVSVLGGGEIEVMLVMLIGSTVGMFAVKDTRRRGSILWAGFFAGLAKFLAILCVGLINSMDISFFINDGLWALASGILSGFIVMGLLPVFEYFFKIPTNISLLELSDLNRPLLKKMALEAPGTYHHCIMVGNMAEAACDAIGANSLLARVGAYYHDIGKISKAEYFSENEMGAGSKHSKLTPQMSALVISKHVKEGVELAKKHKLDNAIIDFISQHHGDGLIAYFYQKAIEKSEDDTKTDEGSFRYPGPKPQTKESAIVLLADSVEASSRSLEEPTPSSINNLVKKIINNKFIDEQLDECDLTLKDTHKIAESFGRVLMGILHTRPSYPEDTVNTDGELSETHNGNKNKQRKQKQKKKN